MPANHLRLVPPPQPFDFAAALPPIAAQAATLEPPAPHERRGVMRPEAAELLDRLLVRVARGRGALDLAIGEGLAALAVGDRALRLGFSCIGDYARERLGMSERAAQVAAQLARGLESRPHLAAAVRSGDVSSRKALTVLAVARGEEEEGWVARARVETVRALAAAVATSRCDSAEPEAEAADERWTRVYLPLDAEGRARLDRAVELAGQLLGATAPRWQRLEAIAQEYLASHPAPDTGAGDALLHDDVAAWLETAKAALEEETHRWRFLAPYENVAAAAGPGNEHDAWRLDAELRRLASLRDRWDDVLGHLAMLFKLLGLWRDARFASFGHYCAERLGMAERTVAQRAALARRLYELPALRRAMQDGRLSYEKARLVASCADDRSAEAWIAKAERLTCIALRREIQAQEEAQTCARGEVDVSVPRRVMLLLDEAVRAARAAAGRWLTPGQALRSVADHFIETWEAALAKRSTPHRRVLARDRGYCQVPGCSRAAVHAHHIVPRSAGGPDEAGNLVALCAAHHLHGVHARYVAVCGRAPDRLTWRLGVSLVRSFIP